MGFSDDNHISMIQEDLREIWMTIACQKEIESGSNVHRKLKHQNTASEKPLRLRVIRMTLDTFRPIPEVHFPQDASYQAAVIPSAPWLCRGTPEDYQCGILPMHNSSIKSGSFQVAIATEAPPSCLVSAWRFIWSFEDMNWERERKGEDLKKISSDWGIERINIQKRPLHLGPWAKN